MRLPRKNHHHGLTLTELLVGLVIVMALSVVAFKAMEGVGATSKTARCASNLRQLGATMLLYAQDNNGYLPQIYRKGSSGHWYYNVSFLALLQTTQAAMWRGELDFYLCPADPDGMRKISADGKTRFLSYAGNLSLGSGDSGGPTAPFKTVRQIEIRNPARYLMLVDSNGFFINVGSRGNLPERHRRGVNILYADGHVDWRPLPLPSDSSAPELWWPDGVAH